MVKCAGRGPWRFWLPGRPVSQKNSKRIAHAGGRTFLRSSDDVLAWREQAALVLRRQMMLNGPLRALGEKREPLDVSITCHLDKGQSMDPDNAVGAPLDALQDAMVIADDRFIEDLHVAMRRGISEPGYAIEVALKVEDDMPCDSKKGGKEKGKPKGGKK